MTRASSLALAAAAGAGLDPGLGTQGGAAASEPIKRAGGPRLRTSLNAYSFNNALNDHLKGRARGVSLLDLLAFCAEHEIDGLDPTGYFFPGYPRVPADQYINQFKRRAFQLGVGISGTGVRNNFASPDRAKRADDVRHVKEWIECAARMGAPVLRVFAGPAPEGHSRDEVFRWMADDLRACVEHAGRYGVLIGIQNHGDTLKTAADVLEIVRMVDSDWFGAIVDTGYFLSKDPYADIAQVAPYAVNWQVKEKLDGAAGNRPTDLRRLVRIMNQAGYRGYVPIETLAVKGQPYDPQARAIELLGALREAIRQER